MRRFIEAFEAGVPATSQPAMDLAEEHRALITEHFYECTYDIHVGLAEMYLADDRFRAHYDNQRPGLAQYVHDAIEANAVSRA